ncbi:protein white-like isoform X1 [Procambarus clarkii]|uniref:protein white-like isoform X1 n=1 Tax=Procambarus clarkii TaxID=6728 RepID=UPI003743AE0D
MANALLTDLLRSKTCQQSWNQHLLASVSEGGQVPSSSTSDGSLVMTGAPDPITYTWDAVNVFISAGVLPRRCQGPPSPSTSRNAASQVHILKNVTGICRPGELLAIMGASGAGKTTLLNVLTHRNNDKLRVTGDIFVNGSRVDPEDLTSRSAYVQQDDLFVGTLTVREQLIFQALLRMDYQLSYDERVRRVNQVIMELGLTKCENTYIGFSESKRISGGEKKRLSFACEVLTNPSLMFCDEPTSGLDSFMAQNVVAMMKNMAERGKTIISTIHQPSSEVYAMFDRVLLMAEGRVAFLGSTDEALKFFNNLNLRCPEQFNPSDFFIDQLSVEPGKVSSSQRRIAMICDVFDASELCLAMTQDVLNNHTPHIQDSSTRTEPKDTSPYKASWCAQFQALVWRAWLEVLREPHLVRIRFFQLMALAVLIGVLYLGQKMNEIGVFNINGVLFLIIINMTFQNVTTVVNTFCSQKELFLREHYNGMYRVDVYFLAKNLVQIPFFTLYAFFYTAIIYFPIGLNPSLERFLLCSLVTVLVSWCTVSFGYLLSCVSTSVNMGLTLLGPTTLPLMIFSGFFINIRSTPWPLKAFEYLSWFSLGNELLVVNQWDGVHNLTCTGVKTCFADGEAVIKRLGFSQDNLVFDFALLIGLTVGYRALAFGVLLMRTYRSKPRCRAVPMTPDAAQGDITKV